MDIHRLHAFEGRYSQVAADIEPFEGAAEFADKTLGVAQFALAGAFTPAAASFFARLLPRVAT